MLDYGIVNKFETGSVVDCSRPPTEAEKAALQAEVTNNPLSRPYRDEGGALVSPSDLDNLINGSWVEDNPVAQPSVAKSSISLNDFGVFFSTAMFKIIAGATDEAGQALLAKWQTIQQNEVALISMQQSVPADSVSLASVLSQLMSDGVVVQSDVDYLMNQPDPAWQAQIVNKARSSVIFDHPIMVEAGDWEGIA